MLSIYKWYNLGFSAKFLLCLIPIYTILIFARFLCFGLTFYSNAIFDSTFSLIQLIPPLLYLNIINLLIFLPFLNILRLIFLRSPFFFDLTALQYSIYNNSTSIAILAVISYPFYSLIYATTSPFLPLVLFINRLFAGSWFLLFFTNLRCKLVVFAFYIASLPYCFISGNRTAIIFPPLLYSISFFVTSFPKFIRRLLYFKFNSRYLIFGGLIFVLLALSFSARLNRISSSNDIISILTDESFRQFFLSATIDRLIPWHLFSALSSTNFLGTKNIVLDYMIHFMDEINDFNYLTDKSVYLGMFNSFGWSPSIGYTIPSTFFIQGAARFSYFGLILYSFIYCAILVLSSFILKLLKFPSFLVVTYFLSFVLIGHFSEPVGQLFKSSFQLCIISSALFFTSKIIFIRI